MCIIISLKMLYVRDDLYIPVDFQFFFFSVSLPSFIEVCYFTFLCRLVCLRVHPMFTLLHPTESYVLFTSVDGSKHEVRPESGEKVLEGDHRPNGKLSLSPSLSLIESTFYLFYCDFISGEWMLVDRCLGLGLVNRFNLSEVYKCYIHWGHGTLNLELWSEDRPVSKQSPLRISHEYEVRRIA